MVNSQFFSGKYQYLMVAVHHIQAPLEQCLNPGWLMIIEDYNTQLCHTPSFTYHFVTHTHTTLSHTFVLHGRRGTFSLRGRRGTCGTGLALVARLGLGAAGRR